MFKSTIFRVWLFHFIHPPNCGLQYLLRYHSCVNTWPLIGENAPIQMNGAFQMNYCMGPNSAIFFTYDFFCWGGIWTGVSHLRSGCSIQYSTSSCSFNTLIYGILGIILLLSLWKSFICWALLRALLIYANIFIEIFFHVMMKQFWSTDST